MLDSYTTIELCKMNAADGFLCAFARTYQRFTVSANATIDTEATAIALDSSSHVAEYK